MKNNVFCKHIVVTTVIVAKHSRINKYVYRVRVQPEWSAHMTRRAVSCKNRGVSAKLAWKIVLQRRGWLDQKFSKSVNSFGPTVFFPEFFRPWLSIGRTKSWNEFATKELRWNKGWFHGTEKFRKSNISWNIDAGEVWSYHFQWILFADANFIACGDHVSLL